MRFFYGGVYTLVIWCMFSSLRLYAQDYCMGARYRSIGNAGVADTSAWAVWNNPAGMSHQATMQFLVSDELLYGIKEIRCFTAGAVIPIKRTYIMGLSLQKQGYQWFNDQQIGIHMAHAIGIYSLSGSFLLWQRIAGETFHALYPVLNLGGIMSLNHSLQIGIHIFNISNTQNADQTLPFQIKLGMLYKLSKETSLFSDLYKRTDQNPDLHIGIEYQIHSHFFLRSGIISNPLRMNGGIGFRSKQYRIDYSITWQEPLGYRHQLSIKISLKGKYEK